MVHGLPSSQLAPANAIVVCEVLSKARTSAGGEATRPSVALTMSVYEPGATVERSSMHGSVSVHPTESGGAGGAGGAARASIAPDRYPAAPRAGVAKSVPPLSSEKATRCAPPPAPVLADA